MISLHDLRCFNDPCVCEPVYVRETVRTIERVCENRDAEVAAQPHTLESRGPSGVLPHIGRACRVTGGRP
jgi:hypothetical protein